ncbi:MAG TPA: TolC family protein [Blastocatellia bacterium]|nr:TolC family protein [Blastocatellia bacterium]
MTTSSKALLKILLIVVTAGVGYGQNPTPAPAPPAQQPTAPTAPPPQNAPPAQPATPATAPLSLDDVTRLALAQASAFQQAQINERLAAEDVRQAQLAFLPRLTSPSTFIYTSPEIGVPATTPRTPAFIAANAVTEYEALIGVTGELDLAGRLRATLRRNRALLEAAHAGTEAARRALVQATAEAYYGLALAAARRSSAELSLSAAQEFERITSLLVGGGEVAEVDLVRARLQTATRRDELEQARAVESAAADSLRVFLGSNFTAPLAVADLSRGLPGTGEVERFTDEAITHRPEFAQFEAQRRAAEFDIRLARAERRPLLTYNLAGGFDTDSLRAEPLRQHSGATGTVSLTIPIFDWGASRSRERQAQLRAQALESTRLLTLRGFAQQFYSARAQALSAAARARIIGASLPDAERNVELSVARYRAGEAQIIEVTDAQNTLAAQRAAYYQALFDYRVALTRLRQATGQ